MLSNVIAQSPIWCKFSKRLPLFTAVLCLLTGSAIFLLAQWQLNQLADEESERIGQTLSIQLAENIRQPVLLKDLVSLQVNVEHLENNPDVTRVTVSDKNNKILAEHFDNTTPENVTLSRHRIPVVVEGAIVAYVDVDINTTNIQQRHSKPLNLVMMIWLLFTVIITIFSFWQGKNLSSRLISVSNRLPNEDHLPRNTDELSMVEQQLEPLLSQTNSSDQIDSPRNQEVAMVALHCKNLERLQAQLTLENIQRLFDQLDQSLDKVTSLYSGTRLSSRDQTLFVEFTGDSEDDHPLRALFCATIILQLMTRQSDSLGIAIEVSAAVTLSAIETSSPLVSEFALEQRQTKSLQLAQISTIGEILADQRTCQHNTVESNINCNEFAGKTDIYAVSGFSKIYSSLLEKQFRFLST